MQRTVTKAGKQALNSSKRRKTSLKTRSISKNSSTKPRKPKKTKSEQGLLDWQANVCNELSTVQFKQAQHSDLIRKSQSELTKLDARLLRLEHQLYLIVDAIVMGKSVPLTAYLARSQPAFHHSPTA